MHVLRHTAASLMFASGRNARQVQAILGHHSAAFTLSVYVHLLDNRRSVTRSTWASSCLARTRKFSRQARGKRRPPALTTEPKVRGSNPLGALIR